MAVFSFDEFVKGMNLVDALGYENKNLKQNFEATRRILVELDKLCPNSFMPFMFIYASMNGDLQFEAVKADKVPEPLRLSKGACQEILSSSDSFKEFIKSCIEEGNKGSDEYFRDTFNGIVINALLPFINALGHNALDYYAWSFSGSLISSAMNVLKEYDTFFTMDETKKPEYFALVKLLIECAPAKPRLSKKDTISGTKTYYGESEKWYGFYDDLIMGVYAKLHPKNQQIPACLTRIVNGLLMNAEKYIMYDPYCNVGEFALNVNAQMSNLRDQKSPLTFVSDNTDTSTKLATTVRLLFRDCRVQFNGNEMVPAKDKYFVAMPNLVKYSECDDKYIKLGCQVCAHNSIQFFG